MVNLLKVRPKRPMARRVIWRTAHALLQPAFEIAPDGCPGLTFHCATKRVRRRIQLQRLEQQKKLRRQAGCSAGPSTVWRAVARAGVGALARVRPRVRACTGAWSRRAAADAAAAGRQSVRVAQLVL